VYQHFCSDVLVPFLWRIRPDFYESHVLGSISGLVDVMEGGVVQNLMHFEHYSPFLIPFSLCFL
jgi:hypothetical protein